VIKRFFLKRFLVFSSIMLIPALLMGTIYCYYVNRTIRKKIEKATKQSLLNVRENVELVLGSASYQQQLLLDDPRLVLVLAKILNRDYITYADSVILDCINSILTSAVNNNLYIQSIYFYINSCPKFLSTADGISILKDFHDNQWFNSYQNVSKTTDCWIENRSFTDTVSLKKVPVVSIFQRLKIIPGVIIINIRPDRFNETLDQIRTEPHQILFISDESGNILFENRNGTGLSGNNLLPYFVEMAKKTDNKKDSVMTPITIKHRQYMMSSILSYPYSIKITSLIPAASLYQQPNDFLMFFFMITVLSTGIVFFLSFYITKKNFRQINHLLEIFKTARQSNLPQKKPVLFKDEYDVILDNVVYMFINTSNLHLQLAEQKLKQKTAEITALQTQINPHFLFNTLQTLDMEVLRLTRQPTEINQIIWNLSDILKYALDDPSKIVTIGDELKYLRLYVKIQQFRYTDKFIIYYEYENDVLHFNVFRLLLQPLVENSLYHGIKPLAGKGYIKLKIQKAGATLKISVIDNGAGMNKAEIKKLYQTLKDGNSQNIGLANVNRRLILYYGSKSALRIASKKNKGTVITFRIPV
jgi:two-component system, sensor histidine kinase YesM